MIELATGGRVEEAGLAAGGRRKAAALGALLVTFALMTLPAAIGVLALGGVIR